MKCRGGCLGLISVLVFINAVAGESDGDSTGSGYVFNGTVIGNDYLLPDEIPLSQLQDEFRERSEKLINATIEADPFFGSMPIFAKLGLDVNLTDLIEENLRDLLDEQNPDFKLLVFVRLMQYTSDYNDLILPVIEKLPLWMTSGESVRIYWSENHMFMYTSSAFLLREMFGENFGVGQNPDLDSRLRWLLTTKIDSGFFEFNSHTYMRFTMGALLNLAEFAVDEEIRELSLRCMEKFVEEWAQVGNTFGVAAVVSARSTRFHFHRGVTSSSQTRVPGDHYQSLLGLLYGFADFYFDDRISPTTLFVAQSDVNFTNILQLWKRDVSLSRSVGTPHGKDDALFDGLSIRDKHMGQMSMGCYAGPGCLDDTFRFLDIYDAWDHEDFTSYVPYRNLPPRVLAQIVASRREGSLLYVEKIHVYKRSDLLLTSLDNFHPGRKGYQQIPWAAVVADVPVTTVSIRDEFFLDSSETGQEIENNQLPKVSQRDNVAIIAYNPNLDLGFIGAEVSGVVLSFFDEDFDEVIDLAPSSRWLFGRRDRSAIAIHRHCLDVNQELGFRRCETQRQVWAVIIKHLETNQTLEDFSGYVAETSTIKTSTRFRCMTTTAVLDGKELEQKFCRHVGGGIGTLLLGITFILLIIICCCGCCWYVKYKPSMMPLQEEPEDKKEEISDEPKQDSKEDLEGIPNDGTDRSL